MMPDEKMQEVAWNGIKEERESLRKLSDSIWKRPEHSLHENYAHMILTDYLASKGFNVQRKYHLPTAFRAEYSHLPPKSYFGFGRPKVNICIICEYDGLPEIGHACGHNLVAEAGVAAALGVKAVMTSYRNIPGKIIIMGTPAKEHLGGKIRLITSGVFRNIDFAMMVHPGPEDAIYLGSFASITSHVVYIGKGSHAAASPWTGVNALDAVVSCYNNLGLLRRDFKPSWNIRTLITNGGLKINIIPDHAELQMKMRAPSRSELAVMFKGATRCAEAAAVSTGCKMKQTFNLNLAYNSLLLNQPILQTYKSFAEEAGTVFSAHDKVGRLSGSTDMGNLSRLIPCIHPYFAIPTTGSHHTKEFVEAAGSGEAQKQTFRAARCLANTALKLYLDSALQQKARKAFEVEKMRLSRKSK